MRISSFWKNLVYCFLVFLPSFVKIPILRLLGARIGKHVRLGIFSLVVANELEMGDFSVIGPFSLIKCNSTLRLGEYSEISSFVLIYGEAGLFMGQNSYIGPRAIINVTRDVRMGNKSAIGPCSVLYTHSTWLPYNEGYFRKFQEILIGDYVWISSSVKILPGVTVGDHTFINAGSVVSKNIPSGVFAEGFPAVPVCDIQRVKRRVTPPRLDSMIKEMVDDFIQEVLEKDYRLEVVQEADVTRFTYRRRRYVLAVICSTCTDLEMLLDKADRYVLMVNKESFQVPTGQAKNTLIFDFTTMNTGYFRDVIHRNLWVFLRRFYGVKFTYVDD